MSTQKVVIHKFNNIIGLFILCLVCFLFGFMFGDNSCTKRMQLEAVVHNAGQFVMNEDNIIHFQWIDKEQQ